MIEREGGVVAEVDNWGMRDLAYPVRKQMRVCYTRLEYQAPAALVAELERNIRISDGIFKFVTVRLADDTAAGEEALWFSRKNSLRAAGSAVFAPTRICRSTTSALTFCVILLPNADKFSPGASSDISYYDVKTDQFTKKYF